MNSSDEAQEDIRLEQRSQEWEERIEAEESHDDSED
jgi:hypothetical protein